MKNPYKTETHRLAFDQAVELIKKDLDRFEVSKQLDHALPRNLRQNISAKAARLLYAEARTNQAGITPHKGGRTERLYIRCTPEIKRKAEDIRRLTGATVADFLEEAVLKAHKELT